jgi:dienelactone hydrolase
LAIRLDGVDPGSEVTLRLFSKGPGETVLASHATFLAAGVSIDLARDAPVAGTYAGIAPMGLFWSRSPRTASETAAPADLSQDPMTLTLTAEATPGQVLARHSIRRSFWSDKVSRRDVRELGLVGRMFEPAAAGAYPAILVVGGSGGGLQWSQEMAALLASHGYAALALAYFGLEPLPPTLDRIPLEYFGKAIQWLKEQPTVDAGRIAVSGTSRGGELALLLAAEYADIRAVVAYVPSGIVGSAYPNAGHSAWTRNGKDLPYADAIVPLARTADAAFIRVENINCPILLISGLADQVWPSAELAEVAVRRLRDKNFAHDVEHLSYAGAGHNIGWPHVMVTMTEFKHPVSGEDLDMGGSPEKTAQASVDSWRRMLSFLEKHLQ